MGRLIDDDIVIDIINFECGKWTGLSKTIEKEIKALPSTQPKRNGWVHIDDIYRLISGHSNYHGDNILAALTCLAEGKDVPKPIDVLKQPERPKGYMKIKVISAVDGEDLFCENCDAYCLSPSYNFCPKCGVEFIGVRGEQE